MRFEQDRAGVEALTGFGPAELDAVTGALLGDLLLWRGDFQVAVDGTPALTERERAHMRDVRGVFTGFWIVVAAAVILLVAVIRRARGTEAVLQLRDLHLRSPDRPPGAAVPDAALVRDGDRRRDPCRGSGDSHRVAGRPPRRAG
jgi:hypothetical protein